jgi:tetraacyldisaccharide 4'-kinase
MAAAPQPPRRIEERLARGGGWVEALWLPAALFGALAGLRGSLYDRGLLPVGRVAAPVVSVGNLSAGGTGKTPATLWLARWFRARGRRPGVLSRGHGAAALRRAEAGSGAPLGRSDEGRLFALQAPDLPYLEEPDRVRGAQALIALGADVILLDDGFQHRRLARDLDLVLIDASRPFGLPWNERSGRAPVALLPRGLLREPPAALGRASALLLTRCDQVPPERLEALGAALLRHAPAAAQVRTRHAPRGLLDGAGGRHGLDRLAGREVELVSGIGNPRAFEASVASLGARIAGHRTFPDHHAYRASDLAGLGQGGRLVLTTEKDLVKLGSHLPGALALSIELELISGGAVLEALLESLPLSAAEFRRRHLHEGLHG